jgi:hypothetical protein
MKRQGFFASALLLLAVPVAAQIQAPALKWQHGGCFSSWCPKGWYASPAVADLDGDGAPEVIGADYYVYALSGATGAELWRVPSGHDRSQLGASYVGRTWAGVVVADIDGDGRPEIATAHGDGWVSVYDHNGYFEPGWPQQRSTSELRGLAVADLDGDGTMEIVVSAALGSGTNTWVLEHAGATRAGWPQLVGDGYAYGVFNDNVALANIDSDSNLEVIVPSDVHYICAYEANGAHIPADPVFGDKVWGQVGVWESYATELRGWGYCNGDRAESYRTNYADGPATVADMNGDGTVEIVATGRTYECSTSAESTRYTGVHIFEPDRGRFVAGAYDWTTVPTDLGAPFPVDWNTIESAQYNPAVGDLDGDGELEIVFSDFSGTVHAFWLDGTEHGAWPYEVYDSGEGLYRLSGEPAIADLDGDGSPEVIIASWTERGSNENGFLHILSATGGELHKLELPAPLSAGNDWNGALAAPTIANIDADSDLELVLLTAYSGVIAYDLPGTARAKVHWHTGRGSYQRAGVADSFLFRDGFESGGTAAWSATVP